MGLDRSRAFRQLAVMWCGLGGLAGCDRPVVTAPVSASPRPVKQESAAGHLVESAAVESPDAVGFVGDECTPAAFRSRWYLQRAFELQALSAEERIDKLRAMAADRAISGRVFVLCRMLFEAREGGAFRHPAIGEAMFMSHEWGGRENAWSPATYSYTDWPLDPITIYEGVPILVVFGYELGGVPEPAASYLEYCVLECRERAERFKPMTDDQVRGVIERFLKAHPSFEWQRESMLQQAAGG